MNARFLLTVLSLVALIFPLDSARALDTDGGLVSDVWEDYYSYGDLVHDADDDGDGLTNIEEYYFNLNPLVRDNHYLTILFISSSLNTVYFTGPVGQRFQWITTDDLVNGSWSNLGSVVTGTGNLLSVLEDPTGIQKRFYRVTPLGALDQDSDLLDAHEEFLLGTSDLLADSDGDKVSDSDEFINDLDPTSNQDLDTDQLPDDWERFHFGDTTSQDASGNPDGDSLNNKEEFDLGLDPNVDESATPSSILSYFYDALGRMTGITAPGSVGTTYNYDPEGNIDSIQ